MEEEEKIVKKRHHKLEVGDKVKVWKKVYNNKNYYNIILCQKNYDNTKTSYYIPLVFPQKITEKPENGEMILIKDFFENYWVNKKDDIHPIQAYTIMDFEILRNEEEEYQNALDNFDKESEGDIELPF